MTNDVHSPKFESKLDPYFSSTFKEEKWGKYRRWDKDSVRSELATTRPMKRNETVTLRKARP